MSVSSPQKKTSRQLAVGDPLVNLQRDSIACFQELYALTQKWELINKKIGNLITKFVDKNMERKVLHEATLGSLTSLPDVVSKIEDKIASEQSTLSTKAELLFGDLISVFAQMKTHVTLFQESVFAWYRTCALGAIGDTFLFAHVRVQTCCDWAFELLRCYQKELVAKEIIFSDLKRQPDHEVLKTYLDSLTVQVFLDAKREHDLFQRFQHEAGIQFDSAKP